MQIIFYSLTSAVIISLVSLGGGFSFLLNKKKLDKIIFLLVGFAAGSLMGGAFFHLIPEAIENSYNEYTFSFLLLGFINFFILEKFILWHHCHKENCEVHPFGPLNLIGDSVHNFIDGIFIFAGFSHSIDSGITVSLLILFHELPQELGDFGVLVYSGYTPLKALLLNLLSAITCIFGVIFSFFAFSTVKNFSTVLLPFIAGGFLYIAASDLIPELHREIERKKSTLSFFMFMLGITLMWALRFLHRV